MASGIYMYIYNCLGCWRNIRVSTRCFSLAIINRQYFSEHLHQKLKLKTPFQNKIAGRNKLVILLHNVCLAPETDPKSSILGITALGVTPYSKTRQIHWCHIQSSRNITQIFSGKYMETRKYAALLWIVWILKESE